MKSAQSSSTYSKNWNNSSDEISVLCGYFLKFIKCSVWSKHSGNYRIELCSIKIEVFDNFNKRSA